MAIYSEFYEILPANTGSEQEITAKKALATQIVDALHDGMQTYTDTVMVSNLPVRVEKFIGLPANSPFGSLLRGLLHQIVVTAHGGRNPRFQDFAGKPHTNIQQIGVNLGSGWKYMTFEEIINYQCDEFGIDNPLA